MADEPKKISFGFSKINKKAPILKTNNLENENNKIEFIDCLEEKSIKLVNGENKKKELPIIPMRVASTLRESIIDTINSRKVKDNTLTISKGKEKDEEDVNGQNRVLTLDELAAKEILEGVGSDKVETSNNDVVQVPLTNHAINEQESTLDDYESMPISDFGLAMLRGMGWDEKKGIGLNEKIVETVTPSVRPKGMGLGADKMLLMKNQANSNNKTTNLVLKKGAHIKVINGPHVDNYGRVEGFDELPGRIIVKLALKNITLSLSEFMVVLVTATEFDKNSKVMNLNKYNEHSNVKSNIAIKEERGSRDEVNRNHLKQMTGNRSPVNSQRRDSDKIHTYKDEVNRNRNKQKITDDRRRSDNSQQRDSDYSYKKNKRELTPIKSNKSRKRYSSQSSESSDEDSSDERHHKKLKKYSSSTKKCRKSDDDYSSDKKRHKHKRYDSPQKRSKRYQSSDSESNDMRKYKREPSRKSHKKKHKSRRRSPS